MTAVKTFVPEKLKFQVQMDIHNDNSIVTSRTTEELKQYLTDTYKHDFTVHNVRSICKTMNLKCNRKRNPEAPPGPGTTKARLTKLELIVERITEELGIDVDDIFPSEE